MLPHPSIIRIGTLGISAVIERTKAIETNTNLCVSRYFVLVSAPNSCICAVEGYGTQAVSPAKCLPLQIKSYLNKGGTVLFIPNSISWLANHLDWKEDSVYVYANRHVNSFSSVSRSTLPEVRVRTSEWQKFHGFCSPPTVISISLRCYRTS